MRRLAILCLTAVLLVPAPGCCRALNASLDRAIREGMAQYAYSTVNLRLTVRIGPAASPALSRPDLPFLRLAAVSQEPAADPVQVHHAPSPDWVTLVEFGPIMTGRAIGPGVKIQFPFPGPLAHRFGPIDLFGGTVRLLSPAWGPDWLRTTAVSRAMPDRAWDAAFTRTAGWTGADGAATVPLPDARILWLFGDTWIGRVENGRHAPGSAMVNNTIAVHRHAAFPARLPPPPKCIKFLWSTTTPPAAWAAPDQPGEWFWPAGGGIVAPGPDGTDRLLLFMTRIARRDAGDSIWNFTARGTSLIIIPNPLDDPAHWRQAQTILTDLPRAPNRREITWGAAVLPDSRSGDLLIYGIDSTSTLRKTLLLARAPAATIHRFDTWRFRTTSNWSPREADAAPIAANVPSELSIHYLADLHRYVMVHSEPPLGPRILARTAGKPEGPWSDPIALYTCPEPAADAHLFVYSAKSHPALSGPGELLISYCVNADDFWYAAAHESAYRPRFIRVPTFLSFPLTAP